MCTPTTHYTNMAFGDTVINFGSGDRWVLSPQATDKCGALVMKPIEENLLPVGALVREDEVVQADSLTVLHFAEIKNVDVMIDALVMLRDNMKAEAEKSKATTVSPESLSLGKDADLDPVAMLEALFPQTTALTPALGMFLKALNQQATATPDEAMLAEFRRTFGKGIL